MKAFNLFSAAALVALTVACGEPVHKTGVVAHRGYWNCEEAGYAKNSIKALEMAQNEGFWGSEFDIQLTSDDVVLVFHDPKIDTLYIWDNPHETFKGHLLKNGESIPTLDEYLTQGEKSDKTMLVCELKQQRDQEREAVLTDLTIEALKAHKLYDPKRVAFISFSKFICEKIAAEHPGFINQYLNGDLAPEDVIAKGINGIDYHFSVLNKNPEWVEQAKANKMSVNAWTASDSASIQKMLDLGVDFITSDEPMLVREMIGGTENVIK